MKRTAGKALNMAVMPLWGSHSSSGVICLGVGVRVRVRVRVRVSLVRVAQ